MARSRRIDDHENKRFCIGTFDFFGVQTAKAAACLEFGYTCVALSDVFYASALLHLLNRSVGCDENDTIADSCEHTIIGVRPTILISITRIIPAIVSLITFPLVGAAIDTTKHRRKFFCGIVMCWMLVIVLKIFVEELPLWLLLLLRSLEYVFTRFCMQVLYSYLIDLQEIVTKRFHVRSK